MSVDNSDVIMSGYENHSPDNGREEASRSYPEGYLVLGVCERHSYRIKVRIRREAVKEAAPGNRDRCYDWNLAVDNHRRTVELPPKARGPSSN